MFENRIIHLFVTVVCVFSLCGLGADAFEVISFPKLDKPCSGILTMTCCQLIRVNPIGMEKKLCVEFKLNIITVKADIKLSLDGKVFIELTVDPKNPPQYCIPIPVPTVAMCLKLHDVKLLDLSSIQICSTLYASFATQAIFSHKFPCVKLSSNGISAMPVQNNIIVG